MKREFISQTLCESIGSEEQSKVELVTCIKDGKSQLIISKTITEHYPVQAYEKVMELYERINGGNGRRVFKLKDLV